MTIPQAVLTLAGLAITLAALVVGLIWKLDAKNTEANRDAHKKIGESIKAVDDRAERRDNRIQAAVSSIARDVSFPAGRQAVPLARLAGGRRDTGDDAGSPNDAGPGTHAVPVRD